MAMINLIVILLVGGLLAILSERISDTMPRKVAMGMVLVDLLYLLVCLSGMPDITQLQAPVAIHDCHLGTRESWLCGHEILYLHPGQWLVNADVDTSASGGES